jgi:drug/metabolite transporter (DMT)-like permease
MLASWTPDTAGSPTSRHTVAGAGFALLAAAAGGAFIVAMSKASAYGVIWSALVARVTVLLLVLIAASLLYRQKAAFVVNKTVILVGILEVASWIMLGVAATHGLLSVVGVLVSLYPIVTVGLARTVHGERLRLSQCIGVAAVFVGVALLGAT